MLMPLGLIDDCGLCETLLKTKSSSVITISYAYSDNAVK